MGRVAKNESVQIDRLKLGPFDTNSYIVTCPLTGDSVLVDAPAEASEILKASKGTNPRYILITHNHMDHIGALSELKSRLKIPIGAHRLDAKGLPLRPEILLEDGEKVSFGKISLKVLHTPGHTQGSACFYCEDEQIVFVGDTLFAGSVGRTDFPEGSMTKLIKSIKEKLLVLPDETAAYPGHGPETTIGREKRFNQFLQ